MKPSRSLPRRARLGLALGWSLALALVSVSLSAHAPVANHTVLR